MACCSHSNMLRAADAAVPTASGKTPAKKKPGKARKKASPAVKDEASMSDSSVEATVRVVGQSSVKYVKKPYKRRKFDNELTIRLLAAAKAALAAPETGQAFSCSWLTITGMLL